MPTYSYHYRHRHSRHRYNKIHYNYKLFTHKENKPIIHKKKSSPTSIKQVKSLKPVVIVKKTEKIPSMPLIKNEKLHLTDYPAKKELKNIHLTNKHDRGPNILSEIFSLLVVILLIPIVLWGIYKLNRINPARLLSGNFKSDEFDKFNIISTTNLGQGKNIHLVEIKGRQLVIGSTVNNISLLTELNKSDFIQNDDLSSDKNMLFDNDKTMADLNSFNNIDEVENSDKNSNNNVDENEETIFYNSEAYKINRLGIFRNYKGEES